MVPGNDWLLSDWGPDPSSGAPHWGDGSPMSAGQVLLPALPGNVDSLFFASTVYLILRFKGFESNRESIKSQTLKYFHNSK